MIKKVCLFLLIVCLKYGNCVGNIADDALNKLKGVASTAGSFVDGMVGSFGYVDPAYVNSFRVVNDTNQNIVAARRTDIKVLGASFSGDVGDHLKLAPYTDSGDFYEDKHLNFTVLVELAKDIVSSGQEKTKTKTLFEKGVPLTIKNDPNTYFYRTYENRGQVRVEYLGVKSMTSAFSGVFYSSYAQPVKLTFTKDDQSYTVTLEPNTFSMLSSSDKQNSIRPGPEKQSNFTFTDGRTTFNVPITAEGVCNMVLDTKTNTLVPGTPMVYTYEIYDNSGSMTVTSQGLAIGNYTEPVDPQKPDTSLVRDINPINVQIWYQSLAQSGAVTGNETPPPVYQMPGTVWAIYVTDDQSIIQKLVPGNVLQLNILRPLVSKKQATLSVVALDTTDDTKAKAWIDRFNKGKIGAYVKPATTDIFDPSQAVVAQAPTDYGIVNDTQGIGNSGVKGHILLTDVFLCQGVGQGPYYYTVGQPLIYADSLVNNLAAVVDTKTYGSENDVAIVKELNTQVTDWVRQYGGNGAAGKSAVISYLKVHGITDLFNTDGSKYLNLQGQRFVDAFTTGALSLSNLPIVYQSGINSFVFNFDKKPDNWPSPS